MEDKIEIINNKEKNRFELFANEKEAGEIDYQIKDSKLIINHTGVNKEYEGKGLAKLLVEYAVNYARENNFKITPICPYVKIVIERNKEYHDLL
ncbi:MAG: GNAT family N-acetyltransferase [Bacteroidales bacterium]|nr:GNAT family N-acetyltransferase [Bacteroidales bacterium]